MCIGHLEKVEEVSWRRYRKYNLGEDLLVLGCARVVTKWGRTLVLGGQEKWFVLMSANAFIS